MSKTHRRPTTQDAIDNLTFAPGKAPSIGDLMKSDGFKDVGDGGKGTWEFKGVTGAISQSPAQLGGALFNDASGNQWALVGTVIYVEQTGAVGSGDVTDSVNAALSASGVKHVIANNEYSLTKASNAVAMTINKPMKFRGRGVFSMTTSSGCGGGVLEISAKDCTVEGLKFDVVCKTVGGDIHGGVGILLSNDVSGLLLDHIEITGERSFFEGLYKAFCISLTDDCEANDVKITNCNLHSCNIILLTSNNFGFAGNKATNWVVVDNNFSNSEGGFSYNSDFATSGADTPWRGITHSNNIHDNLRGSIGTDSCVDIAISGNVFRNSDTGSTESAIHLENLGGRGSITGNTFHCISGGAIKVYGLSADFAITGNTMTGGEGRVYSDDVLSFQDPDSISVGVFLVNDDDGSPQRVVVSGNNIANFREGIHATSENDDMVITGNLISLCSSAFFLRAGGGIGVIDNSITNCKYLYEIGGNRGLIGKNQAIDCGILFFDKIDDVMLNGLVWTINQTIDLPDGVTTSIPLFENPVRADTQSSILLSDKAAGPDHIFSTVKMDIDNSANITSSEGVFLGVGGLTIPPAPYEKVAGLLRFNVFNNSGQQTTALLTIDITGVMMWS